MAKINIYINTVGELTVVKCDKFDVLIAAHSELAVLTNFMPHTVGNNAIAYKLIKSRYQLMGLLAGRFNLDYINLIELDLKERYVITFTKLLDFEVKRLSDVDSSFEDIVVENIRNFVNAYKIRSYLHEMTQNFRIVGEVTKEKVDQCVEDYLLSIKYPTE